MSGQYNAVCDIMNVPLNPSGLFTIGFSSNAARDSAMSGYVVSAQVNFCYLPKEGILKVEGNAGGFDAVGANYVRFRNPDFNNEYIYAFITRIEYLAQFTSALHIEVDSFMTYQTRIVPNQCFIERERVALSDDVAGRNVLPEPVSMNTYTKRVRINRTFNTESVGGFTSSFKIGVVVGGLNIYDNDPNAAAKTFINSYGTKYLDGSPLGGALLCVDYGVNGQVFSALIEAIAALSGKVVAAIPIPQTASFSSGSNFTFNRGDGTSVSFTVYTVTGGVSIADITNLSAADEDNPWNFTPKNKKLFSYPYMYLVGSNHAGSESVYRYDLFRANNTPDTITSPSFEYRYIIAASPSIILNPQNYEGGTNLSNAVINNNLPQIPWDSDPYANYIGQHLNSLAYTQIKRSLDYGINLASGVGSGDLSGMIKGGFDFAMSYEGRSAELADLKGLGDDVHNAPSGCAQGAFVQLGVSIYQKFIASVEARRIDNFFSRFGYRVDRVGTISWNKRSDYDYIKTQGANIGGAIPAADKAKINALFDAGITIWHSTSGYGVYDIV